VVFDAGGDDGGVARVESLVAWFGALEVEVVDAAGLHAQLGPHGGAVRDGERLG
jgi:hypothetical protein